MKKPWSESYIYQFFTTTKTVTPRTETDVSYTKAFDFTTFILVFQVTEAQQLEQSRSHKVQK